MVARQTIPYPTCCFCGAYSIFTNTKDGILWLPGCECAKGNPQPAARGIRPVPNYNYQ